MGWGVIQQLLLGKFNEDIWTNPTYGRVRATVPCEILWLHANILSLQFGQLDE